MLLVHSEEPYQCQSSVEDTTTTTTTSDSVDLEVTNLEEHPNKTDSISNQQLGDSTKKTNPFASLKAKFCSAHFAVNRSIGLLSEAAGKTKKEEGTTKIQKDWEGLEEIRRNSDQTIRAKDRGTILSSSTERQSPKNLRRQKKDVSFSKSTSFLTEKRAGKSGSNLRIRICKCSENKCGKAFNHFIF